jgi:hypothetical protein
MLQMRKLVFPTLACALLIGITSCGSDQQASSTPIDSTNLHGTAPATYGSAQDSTYPKYEGQDDSGRRANTSSEADSM